MRELRKMNCQQSKARQDAAFVFISTDDAEKRVVKRGKRSQGAVARCRNHANGP